MSSADGPEPTEFAARAVVLAGLMARLAGWPPATFWAATPAEAAMTLAAWVASDPAPAAMDRARLNALMKEYPDGI